VSELIHPRVKSYRKRLIEIKAKISANEQYMKHGNVIEHLKKHNFDETVDEHSCIISGRHVVTLKDFDTLKSLGDSLGKFTTIMTGNKDEVLALFDNGADCGDGRKKKTIVTFMIILGEYNMWKE